VKATGTVTDVPGRPEADPTARLAVWATACALKIIPRIGRMKARNMSDRNRQPLPFHDGIFVLLCLNIMGNS
jgi:hypothetical protein